MAGVVAGTRTSACISAGTSSVLENVSAGLLKKRKEQKRKKLAGTTGLEPATSDVTGRRSNQLNYVPFEV